MERNVLVLADIRNDKLRNVTFESLTAARKLADGGTVYGALLGKNVSGMADALAHYGADQVFVVENDVLANYVPDAFAIALETVIRESGAEVVLMAHSAIGRDLAPKLAARFEAGQVSDIVDVQMEGDKIVFTRPIYAGKAFTKNVITDDMVFATVRPNNLPAAEPDTSCSANVTTVSVDLPADSLRTFIKEVVKKSAGGADLSEAKIIVSGGRGVKSADGFKPLQELADALGAAVGASRGACDAGYCDYALQIGQTGKVVTPDLYIACGISGAIQHLAGMSNSKVIVAINKDPEAPIFKVADYGIVGDLFEVVPLLTEELKKLLCEEVGIAQ
ncbi:electron transfer flavoprotein subunit alpha/FixB family protein [Effusibacillus lacus]|uniref:Electron transfer flavoprotein subunit alpha n=1 Tax=Effusibacillus lacus TaxID=1348429 RepID=A0A292YH13_9BACL|nr:electron transfer flavoprotein subunit alpha/FixB family protein [Effusibacillus lacus]TCS70969.1 electron transfer flavoprotein alpha subunit apoprotein [Effusibacillus lacus]GAX89997.1 electron transfer flavoprotein subunit alpha [Effusibacillus lacus]